MGEVFRKLAAQKESRIEVAGDRLYQKKKCYPFGAGLRREEAEFVGQHFWARGYFVSTVGRDEEVIRQYIKNQEAENKRLDQLRLWN